MKLAQDVAVIEGSPSYACPILIHHAWFIHSELHWKIRQEITNIPTACGHTIAHRKWKETKLQPGTARPGNRLGYCLVSSHFLRAILCPKAVHNFAFFIHVCPLFSSDPVWRILYPMLKDSELYRAFHQNKVWIWNDYVLKYVHQKSCRRMSDSRTSYISSVTISASANNFLSW